MGKFLIVSYADEVENYRAIAEKYNVGFEYNDFYMPLVLQDENAQQRIMKSYYDSGIPKYCTMHGAFFDTIIFSYDDEIRNISKKRMIQSMEIAERLKAKAVIFHTNASPFLTSEEYVKRMTEMTVEFLEKLLSRYKNTNIYLENMFDRTPVMLSEISEKLKKYSNYGVCFDYAHASISGTSIKEWVEELKPYIRHLHINDNDLENDLHLAVGDGKIDWLEFKEYYDRYFSDCTVLIETTSPGNQVKSLEYLNRIGIRTDI